MALPALPCQRTHRRPEQPDCPLVRDPYNSPSVPEAAKGYLAQGYAPIPVPAGRKSPQLRGWPDLRLSCDEVADAFGTGGNIGLLLGKPSGWLIDVDLDCDEAVALADEHLPATESISGRASRPRSHRWYRCVGAVSSTHADPETGAMIAEIRSTGRQTLVWPSVHPDGDAYDRFEGTPAEVSPKELIECMRSLVDAVVRSRGRVLVPTPAHTADLRGVPVSCASDWSTSAYGESALRAECQQIGATPQGGRNTRLNTGAFRLGQLVGGGELDEGHAWSHLHAAAVACGLPDSEARRTIGSGLQAGIASPRQRAERTASIGLNASDAGPDDPVEEVFISAGTLMKRHPQMRTPIIEGLLRSGETMNIIAGPKTGKSWFMNDLALAIATGRSWLGEFKTIQGDVLIIDNELHPETTAHRIPMVANARGITRDSYSERLFVKNLRGGIEGVTDIHRLADALMKIDPGRFAFIGLDAMYRFMPDGESENDNSVMTSVYNAIDRIARHLDCGIGLVHHTSKGVQGGKSVTDVGAGAGSQSRAADTHLVLRPHEEAGAIVLDAAVRSWSPIDARCLRWDFPVWQPAPDLDPDDIQKSGRRSGKGKDKPAKPEKPEPWTPERFVEAFIGEKPQLRDEIELAVSEAKGLSKTKSQSLLSVCVERGLVFRHQAGHSCKVRFSTLPPEPATDEAAS